VAKRRPALTRWSIAACHVVGALALLPGAFLFCAAWWWAARDLPGEWRVR
jgi:hypothetical protein